MDLRSMYCTPLEMIHCGAEELALREGAFSSNFVYLTIQLNAMTDVFSKTRMWKVALVSQNLRSFRKNCPKETRENLPVTLLIFVLLTSLKVGKDLYFHLSTP